MLRYAQCLFPIIRALSGFQTLPEKAELGEIQRVKNRYFLFNYLRIIRTFLAQVVRMLKDCV